MDRDRDAQGRSAAAWVSAVARVVSLNPDGIMFTPVASQVSTSSWAASLRVAGYVQVRRRRAVRDPRDVHAFDGGGQLPHVPTLRERPRPPVRAVTSRRRGGGTDIEPVLHQHLPRERDAVLVKVRSASAPSRSASL